MRPKVLVIGHRFHAQPRGLLSSIYVGYWHINTIEILVKEFGYGLELPIAI